MNDLTLLINRAAVPEWYTIVEPATLEAGIKKKRKVVKWRKKKFVIRDPWAHIAFTMCNGKTNVYINNVKVKETKLMSAEQCMDQVGPLEAIDEVRLSNIVRPNYVS
jgi:hypothetical protein